MPSAAPRPCKHSGCGRLVLDVSGYCTQHQSEKYNGRFGDARRGSRHARGYGTEWDRKRRIILRRDNGLCQVCLQKGFVQEGNTVDHKVPKAEGGTDDDSNLQTICDDCHKEKTAQEALRGRLGWVG